MPTQYEATYHHPDGRKPQVWCNSPHRDDVFRFLAGTSPQLAEGHLELAVFEHNQPPLPPETPLPAGWTARNEYLHTMKRPW